MSYRVDIGQKGKVDPRLAYNKWAQEARSYTFTVPEQTGVAWWHNDELPAEIVNAERRLRATIRRGTLTWTTWAIVNRGVTGSLGSVPTQVVFGDYPRPGDTVTIRW